MAEEFNASPSVFVVKVIRARQVLDLDGFIQGTFATLRIEELLKGSPRTEVEVYEENSSGRFPMNVGVRYLLFVYERVFEGVDGPCLAVNGSGNSATLKQAKKVLATVRQLRKGSTDL